MRFVLGNRLMVHVGGTEVHLVTLAEHLRRLGHEAVIYSPELGAYAEHARDRGLDVVASVGELPEECDVVLSQDAIVVYQLAERYPRALHAFRVCGDVFDFQLPPQLDGVIDVVIALSDRYARFAAATAVRAPIVRLRVPVDVDLRTSVGTIRERPRRAVMLGNYPDRYEVVRDVWGDQGVEVARVGMANGGSESYDVTTAVAGADIVVAKSRAALEAMACGRAVYVFDVFGGDGWVTPEIYPALESDNFAGMATGRVVDAGQLARDLADYDPAMGVANRDLILQHHSARDHVVEMLAALAEHSPPAERPTLPSAELARLSAVQWSWERMAREHRDREGWLRDRVGQAEAAVADAGDVVADATRERDEAVVRAGQLERELSVLSARIAAMRATKAWRLASRYWRLRAWACSQRRR
jgi:glycosyltransferase involved in cell wall biosynthesis